MGAGLFGIGGVIAKEAFAAGLVPSVLAELRVLFAFPLLLAGVAAFRREDLSVRRADLPLLLFFGVVCLGGVQWSYYEAIQRLPLGIALVIQYTGPLLLLAYAKITGRRVGARLWVAAALAVAGCYLVVGAYDSSLLSLNAPGLILAVISAVLFAAYLFTAEHILVRYTIWTLLVYGFGFALVAWAVARPLWTLPWAAIDVRGAALVAAVVTVSTVVPFALTFAAVSRVSAARVGLMATLEPVVGALAAWIVFAEVLQPPQLAGGALTLVGIALARSLRPATNTT